ncbi:hypothetical protein N6H18_14025 [Reichenbachiella agarivorans]|uniref:GTP cyclohydrolase n=1 Tax=Reichenbachiella agarivorans TaxID=2979464 RepID=A0ABY6CLT2_9BACT|nr:hypothetical protein [Reichenbachiella agarivorans]UXP31466.1 hypothetical protein N6H18_14025 [Reichenbachiella agarivorans]
MRKVNHLKKYSIYAVMLGGLIFTGCSDDDTPEVENEEEVITDVTLVFTNDDDPSDVVTARAEDPDGAGLQELTILDEINLGLNKSYTLTLQIENNLNSPGEDITEEVEEESDEHQFFFSFTDGAFANPTGDGNIDNAADPLNYNDEDANGNPVGLSTAWTTAANALSAGSFSLKLQHLPDIKSSTSEATDGDTDIALTFVLNIN